MKQAAAHDVLVGVALDPVLGRADVAADGQPRAAELLAQTHVQRHVGVVGVHVQS